MSFSDLALAQRLERTEGRANADFVDARALTHPDRGAAWIEAGGALAMFDGIDSPLTQTFALGLQGAVAADDLDRIELFFAERNAPVFHEISPLADPSLLPLLNARGYQPVEFTSVLWQPIASTVLPRPGRSDTPADPGLSRSEPSAGPGLSRSEPSAGPGLSRSEPSVGPGFSRSGPSAGPGFSPGITARPIRDDEHELWARIGAAGWSHLPELEDFLHELAKVNVRRKNHVCFLAERSRDAIAAGGLAIVDGVALLAGASTVPAARRQGAQRALLDARLRYAAEHGCDLAMMGASPGSDSQRNAEREGFRIAYTRIKWKRVEAAGG